jgi:hypothetical protein
VNKVSDLLFNLCIVEVVSRGSSSHNTLGLYSYSSTNNGSIQFVLDMFLLFFLTLGIKVTDLLVRLGCVAGCVPSQTGQASGGVTCTID